MYVHVPLALALVCASTVAWATQHASRLEAAPPSSQNARKHAEQPGKSANATKSAHRLTLEQAVARVQNQTGGKVLKADSQNRGRIVEYRIKVLTPDGHVRVLTLRSDDHDAQ